MGKEYIFNFESRINNLLNESTPKDEKPSCDCIFPEEWYRSYELFQDGDENWDQPESESDEEQEDEEDIESDSS